MCVVHPYLLKDHLLVPPPQRIFVRIKRGARLPEQGRVQRINLNLRRLPTLSLNFLHEDWLPDDHCDVHAVRHGEAASSPEEKERYLHFPRQSLHHAAAVEERRERGGVTNAIARHDRRPRPQRHLRDTLA